MITRKIYVDESGNSGPNYLDKNEKYFILAGWLDIEKSVENENYMNRLAAFFKEGEGKNYKLANSVEGRNIMADVLEYMENIKCKPFIAIANKRFCIAARIVEELLDPVYNNKIPLIFDDENYYGEKQRLAYFLYDTLNDDDLQEFAEAYRGKNMLFEDRRNRMINSIEKIENALLGKNDDLARIIANAKININDNLADEIPDDNNISKMMALQAPNVWIANNLSILLDHNGKKYGYGIQIIHDEQEKYDKHIKEMIELVKNHNNELTHILGLDFANSAKTPMLQAADILAGSVNLILKKRNKNWKNDDSFKRLLNSVLPCIEDYGNKDSRTYFMEHPLVWQQTLDYYIIE